jgi:hypothetical protein
LPTTPPTSQAFTKLSGTVNGDNSTNAMREISQIIRSKQRGYLKDKVIELERNRKITIAYLSQVEVNLRTTTDLERILEKHENGTSRL